MVHQLNQIKLLLPDVSEELLILELELAADAINGIRSYEPTDIGDVEKQYRGVQVQLALAAYNKRGAEGQSSHSENGIARVYGSSDDYPPHLLRRVIPKLRGIKR